MTREWRAAMDVVMSTHTECRRWFRLVILPNHLIGEQTDGTYRAFSLTNTRQEMDISPMPDDLIPFARSVRLRVDDIAFQQHQQQHHGRHASRPFPPAAARRFADIISRSSVNAIGGWKTTINALEAAPPHRSTRHAYRPRRRRGVWRDSPALRRTGTPRR
jgi:hypothetical protein